VEAGLILNVWFYVPRAFDLMEMAVLIWKVEFDVCVNFAYNAHFYRALFKAMGVSMSYVDLNNSSIGINRR